MTYLSVTCRTSTSKKHIDRAHFDVPSMYKHDGNYVFRIVGICVIYVYFGCWRSTSYVYVRRDIGFASMLRDFWRLFTRKWFIWMTSPSSPEPPRKRGKSLQFCSCARIVIWNSFIGPLYFSISKSDGHVVLGYFALQYRNVTHFPHISAYTENMRCM